MPALEQEFVLDMYARVLETKKTIGDIGLFNYHSIRYSVILVRTKTFISLLVLDMSLTCGWPDNMYKPLTKSLTSKTPI